MKENYGSDAWNNKKEEYRAVLLSYDLGSLLPPPFCYLVHVGLNVPALQREERVRE